MIDKQIVPDDGCYYRVVEGQEKLKRLTNFRIALLGIIDGRKRKISLQHWDGCKSGLFDISPIEMIHPSYFRKIILEKGNYLFFGNEEDLSFMWEFIFERKDQSQMELI